MQQLKNLQEQVELAPYTTMKVGGPADYLVVVRTAAEVKAACDWAAAQNVPVFVLGEGSNIVVSGEGVHKLVMKVELAGFEAITEDDTAVTLRVGAGEHWDGVVERTVEQGWAGIEAMSMIPGTAGAAPVQNAGAYGQEIANTLVELEAYDMNEHRFVTLKRADCGFAYRHSRFKGDWAGRFVITRVTLRLSKQPPAEPTYASLRRWLDENAIAKPTVAQIREGVMAIRARILPDPSVVPNSGSFFKNPIVDGARLAELKKRFPDIPSYEYEDKFKLSAGWILDQCGFKGQEHFGFKFWTGHALVITNPGGSAGYDDLLKLVDLIVRTAQDKFGITLEPEPLFVG
ncbi:MAG: UDP-N-acetylenolpyruvoylglucosamine reductase [Patescibacteria group bacterium]|nr:UDP-N-acetylenolpyruvoylglucosamine reductase [Patescibacteria group bacterium]